MRFKAHETIYGYAQSIQEMLDSHLPASEGAVLDANADTATLQRKALKLNSIAICNFTMALTTESLMGIVYSAIGMDCCVPAPLPGPPIPAPPTDIHII
eukprot:12211388-Ditylum_brightwellii.AAC.1